MVIGDKGQLGGEVMAMEDELPYELLRASTYGIDITQRDALHRYLDDADCDAVINCAAYTAVDRCESEEGLATEVNANGPQYMAEWAKLRNASLLHVSTDYVFPGDKTLFKAYQETDDTGPVNAYGRSKLAGEQAIGSTMASNFAILRTAWVYGVHGHNFLKTMLRLALADAERELKVVDDQYGSPTWTFRLAEQMAALLKTIDNDESIVGVLHATAGGYCSWYEFAAEFFQLMGVKANIRPCTTEEYPTPARRPSNSILENTRLEQSGLNCFDDWRPALAAFVARHGDQLMREAHEAIQLSKA